jgi:hypothetical protein
MIDERRQADSLREQLDRELVGVQATAQARQRLRNRAAAPSPSSLSSPGRRLLRPAIAAVAVLAVIAVPVLVRSSSGGDVQPARVPPASSTTVPAPTVERPTRVPTARPATTPSLTRNPRASTAVPATGTQERRAGTVPVRPTAVPTSTGR